MLEPLAKPNTPASRAVQTTASWSVLAWIRRTFFNQHPSLSYDPTQSVQVDDTVTGTLNPNDPDGDLLTYTVTAPINGGSVTVRPDGTFTYTPTAGIAATGGTDSFDVTASDAGSGFHLHGVRGLIHLITFGLVGDGGHSTTTTVTVDIDAAPIPATPPYILGPAEHTTGTVPGELHVSDADADALVYTVTGGPANGSVALSPDGTFTYTPTSTARHDASAEDAEAADLADSFVVTVDDNHGRTVDVPVTVAIDPTNAPPTITGLAVSDPDSDGTVNVSIAVTDPDTDPITYLVVHDPSYGTVVPIPGGFAYTPTAQARHIAASTPSVDVDSFQITASDLHRGVDTATATVVISPANIAPSGLTQSVNLPDPTTGVVTGTVTGTDADGDTLTYRGSATTAKGQVIVGPDGTFDYTPTPQARHDAAADTAADADKRDSFTVTADDAHGGTADIMVTVAVSPINAAPTIETNVGAPDPGTGMVTGGIVATDPDGDGITYTVSTDPARGAVAVDGDGAFAYTPTPEARHAASSDGAGPELTEDTFTVTVDDGHGAAVPVPVTVTVSPTNRAPTATVASTPGTGDTWNVGVSTADLDNDAVATTITATDPTHVTVTGTTVTVTDTAWAAANPGEQISVTVTADDGHGGTFSTTVPIGTVNNAAAVGASSNGQTEIPALPPGVTYTDATAGGNHTVLLRSDGTAIGTRGYDSDTPPLPDGVTYTDVDAGGHHTVLLRSDGIAIATGDNDFGQTTIPALPDGLTYTDISAGGYHTVLLRSDGTATATGRDTEGQNDIPALPAGLTYTDVDAGDYHTVLLRSDGTAIAIGNNDSGQTDIPALPDGVTYTGIAAGRTHTVLLRSDGTAVAVGYNGSGQTDIPALPDGVTYTDADAGGFHTVLTRSDGTAVAVGYNGSGQTDIPALPDGVTYTDADAGLLHTVLLRDPITNRPTAVADTATTDEDTPVVLAPDMLLANDTDPNGSPLQVISVFGAEHGSTAMTPDGTVTYTPAPDYNGTDTFTYVMTNAKHADTATVTVTVTPVNDAPIAGSPPFVVTATDPGTGTVSGTINATDVEADSLTYVLTGPAENGVATVNPDGTFTYDPTDAARLRAAVTPGVETDSFTVTLSDGHGGSTVVPVSGVTVSPAQLTVTDSIIVGADSRSAVASPDGSRVYVSNMGSSSVSVIDTATNEVVETITGWGQPYGMAASRDGSRVYLAEWFVTWSGRARLWAIDTTTNAATPIANVGTVAVAVSPDGTRVYTTNYTAHSVSVVNTADNSVVAQITLNGTGGAIAMMPDGSRAYATEGGTNKVAVIDTATNTILREITLGNGPNDIAFSQDSTRAYVTNYYSGTVSVVDTSTDTEIATIPVAANPMSSALSPDGSVLYVNSYSPGVLSAIDTATNTLITSVALPNASYSMAVTANGDAYITNSAGPTVVVSVVGN